MSGQPPLPKRIAWFAPWTWKRRWYTPIVLLWLLVYTLSYGPVTAWAIRLGWVPMGIAAVIFLPFTICANFFPACEAILDWYWQLFF